MEPVDWDAPNPYDETDPRFDEFESARGEVYGYTPMDSEPADVWAEARAALDEQNHARVIHDADTRRARGEGKWAGGSLVWDAVDWSM